MILPIQSMQGEQDVQIDSFDRLKQDSSIVHRHDYDLILWSAKGTGLHMIDHIEYKIEPGKLFIIKRGQIHQVIKEAEDMWLIRYKSLPITTRVCNPVIDFGGNVSDTCRGLFSLFQAEARKKTVDKREVLDALINAIVACTISQQQNSAISSADIDLLTRLQEMINENFIQHRDIQFYCLKLKTPARSLNKTVKSMLNKSVLDLINEKLIDESKTLLMNQSLSVKQIAYQLGFLDPAYFNRFFRKFVGSTPGEYRRSVFL